jgi:hypothetical protein
MRCVRFIAIAVAAMALLPLPLGPTAEATSLPTVARWTTISGTSGFADVHLSRFAPIDTAFSDHARPTFMRIHGDPGAIVVLMSMKVVRGDAKAPWIPIIKLPAAGNHRVAYWHTTSTGLPPGDYRLFLIASRPTAVRFFVPGQTYDATSLHASTSTRSVQSVVNDASPATDSASTHTNSLFFTVRRRAMAFGVDWFRAPEPPLARVLTACTYADDPIGGQTLPGCPGAFLVYDYDVFPYTTDSSMTGYAVGPDPEGRIGVRVDDEIVGPVSATGSALYYFEY